MTLKTSLLVTGDSSVAQAAVEELAGEVRKLTTASEAAVAGAKKQAAAQSDATASARAQATAQRDAGSGASELARGMQAAATTTDNLAQEAREATAACGGLAEAQRRVSQASRDNTKAANDNVRSAGQIKAGYQQVGQQLQDVGIMAMMSQGKFSDFARIAAFQGGSLAAAIDMIGVKGAGGRLAAFFAGPWGAVILTGTAVLAPMIEKLLETGSAADEARERMEQAAGAADTFGAAQSLLAKVIDTTTGKLKTQNATLVQQIRLAAQLNIQQAAKEQKTASQALGKIAEPSLGDVLGAVGENLSGFAAGRRSGEGGRALTQRLQPLKDAVADYQRFIGTIKDPTALSASEQTAVQRGTDAILNRITRLGQAGKLAGKDIIDAKQAVLSLATTVDAQIANQAVVDAIDGKAIDARLKPYERPDKPRKPTKPASTAARDEFGRDAADKLAGIVGQFDGAPDIIEKTNAKVRELDDLIEDLGRRKPPNFAALIAQAEEAKTTVRVGLIGTIAEAFDRPKTLADRAGLALADLDAVITDLSARQPVDWQKAVAAANAAKGSIADALNRPLEEYLQQADEASRITGALIEGRGQEAEALRIILQLERERGPLSEAQAARVRDSVAARREEAAALERVRRSQLIYLDGAREVRDAIDDATQAWVRGDLRTFLQTPAKLVDSFAQLRGRELFEGLFGEGFADLERALTEGPAEKAARAMAGELDNAGDAAADMTGALDRAAPAIDAFVRSVSSGAPGGSAANAVAQAQPAIDAYIAARFGKTATGGTDEIVVEGQRRSAPRMSTEQLFTNALTKASSTVAGLFTSKDNAGRIGAIIGDKATTAIKGAADGAAVAGVAGFLGIKMSGAGSQIGGALGSLTGIPGASIVGSILGGLIGNEFKGPTRSGYAAIGTDAGGSAFSTVSGGKNSEGRRTEAVGYGNTIMDRLGQIAGSLGGTLAGGLNLGTIGTQGDKYVFDRDGAGSAEGIKVDSLQEAVAEALRNAVVNGAVSGVSEAVKRALGSGKDIERAVAEAGAVRQLEASLGGVAGAIKAQFDDFNSVAAERVRLAKSYGLDLLAVEKKNAEDRNKIAEQLVKAQVGSLKSLIEQMTTGDLAEGSAMDRIAALDDAIGKAKADLAAGVDGAGDVLARLYEQRLSTSKEAYGTTGQYAADRDRVLVEAREAIAQATARVDAGRGSDPALAATNVAIATTNATLDENNDQNAEMIAVLREQNDLLRGMVSGGGRGLVSIDVAQLARV
ncbi:hypothetical protein [Sphingomonas panni]|uniref:hypothetical protein n=1 Tax=Sphingomonas panni TaxID=237612 RepID=UPI001F5BB743|nr:hypothetical protein [Sphingomonas panni]